MRLTDAITTRLLINAFGVRGFCDDFYLPRDAQQIKLKPPMIRLILSDT